MNFDATAVDAWVALCDQQTKMRNEGASQEAVDALNARIICAMVALLPDTSEEAKAALTLLMLSDTAAPPAPPSDPAPLIG